MLGLVFRTAAFFVGVMIGLLQPVVAQRTFSIVWSPADVAQYRNWSNPLKTELGDMLSLQCVSGQPSNLFIQFEEIQHETCNATAGAGEYVYSGFCLGDGDTLMLTLTMSPFDIHFEDNRIYYITSYYNGNSGDISNALINSGGECEAGLKMAFVIGELNPITQEPTGTNTATQGTTIIHSLSKTIPVTTDELNNINSFQLESIPLIIGLSVGVPLAALLLITVCVVLIIILWARKHHQCSTSPKPAANAQLEQMYDYPSEVNLAPSTRVNLQQNWSYGEIRVSKNESYDTVESSLTKTNEVYSEEGHDKDIQQPQDYEVAQTLKLPPSNVPDDSYTNEYMELEPGMDNPTSISGQSDLKQSQVYEKIAEQPVSIEVIKNQAYGKVRPSDGFPLKENVAYISHT